MPTQNHAPPGYTPIGQKGGLKSELFGFPYYVYRLHSLRAKQWTEQSSLVRSAVQIKIIGQKGCSIFNVLYIRIDVFEIVVKIEKTIVHFGETVKNVKNVQT